MSQCAERPSYTPSMTTQTKTVEELIKSGDSPLPLEVIPNKLGINLCSVKSLTWTAQDDGQIVSLTIHFDPDPREQAATPAA